MYGSSFQGEANLLRSLMSRDHTYRGSRKSPTRGATIHIGGCGKKNQMIDCGSQFNKGIWANTGVLRYAGLI